MRAKVGADIRVYDADQNVISWAHTNLRVANPDYAKKKRMGFWTGNTPEEIKLYVRDGKDYIFPAGCYEPLREAIPYLEFEAAFPTRKIFPAVNVPLYDYQEREVDKLIRHHFGILKAPCGGGKTRCGLAIAGRDVGRVLWLTHTNDLLNQSKAAAEEFFDNNELGVISDGKVEIGSRITFAMVQTMSKLNLRKYMNTWSTVIVDECHRVCGSPTNVMMFYKVLSSLNASRKYGLSATVHRADGLIRCTHAILGPIIGIISEVDVADKTSPVEVVRIDTNMEVPEEALDTDGTIIYARLITSLAEDDQRNILLRDSIIKDYKEHSSLCLSERLAQLEIIRDRLIYAGADPKEIRFISGTTKAAERVTALDDMRRGKAKILLATYGLAKEGLDIPVLDRLHLLTPQKDYAVVIQAAGRVARKADGKGKGIVYDYVDDIGYCERAYASRKSFYKKKGYVVNDEHGTRKGSSRRKSS